MERFEQLARRLGTLFNGVALVALSVMLVVVSADIVGAKFLSKPVPGAMDLLSLLGLVLIGFSTARTYTMGRHIKVTFVSMLLPPRVRTGVRFVSTFLCLLLFCTAVWRILLYAGDLREYGESSMTVNIPLAPFAYALGIAFVPVAMLLCVEFYRLLQGRED